VTATVHEAAGESLHRFNPYLDYKESGVEWLGQIPAHWNVRRLKFLAPARISKLDSKPVGAVYLGLEHIESWTGRLLLDNQPGTVDSVVATFKAGDVLFGKLRPYLAKAARPDFDGVCTSEILPLRPIPECSQSYLMYCLLNVSYIRWLESLTYGAKMPRLSPEQLGDSPMASPPAPEQRAIAAFLDRETARIDALVAKKERLIELLQEKRTALITRAVTKGLDLNVPMKDVGVEWLGTVPAHWGVMQLGQTMQTIMDFRGRTPLKLGMDWGGDIPAISAVNVRDGYLDLSRGVNYGSQALHDRWMSQGRTQKGDIVFTTEAPLGNVALLEDDNQYILSQRVVLFRPARDRVEAEYLRYFLTSSAFRQGLGSWATGSTAEGVKRRYLTAMPVCIPPVSEQRTAVALIDRELTLVNPLFAKAREVIDRLQELRTALISAAVTGKIDVREEAA
jgi:type I restriction enzyme, S subunit